MNLIPNVETKGTFAFVSLGCPKNLVDSERMLGKLAQDGCTLVPDADGADVVVVNTCGFIEPARQESLAAAGYPVRVYVPFGAAWYPYFMRRLAERPANVWFFARSLFRRS